MHKYLLLSFILCLGCTCSFAQKKFYVNVKAGYDLPVASESRENEYLNTESFTYHDEVNPYSVFRQKKMKWSYGKGFTTGLNFGYTINKYLAVELGAAYHHGAQLCTYTENKEVFDISESLSNNASKVEHLYYARTFNFSISGVLSPGFKQWNPYLKIGLLYNCGNYYRIGKTFHSSTQGSLQLAPYREVSNTTEKYSGLNGLGVQSSAGIVYNILDFLSVFAEVNLCIISSAPDRSEIIKLEEYSPLTNQLENTLPSKNYSLTHTEYVDKLAHRTEEAIRPDKASQGLKQTHAFSSIGFYLGLKFKF